MNAIVNFLKKVIDVIESNKERFEKVKETDSRIKVSRFTWQEFNITYIVLLVLATGQALILTKYINVERFPFGYIAGMLGYWALVTAVFVATINFQRYMSIDRPMKKLSNAAKRVTEGDFSVQLAPIHKPEKYDFVDVMIEDFNKMVEELGSTETLKSDFIANVSHEIKTPLSVIQSYAMALQRQNISPQQQKEYADTIIEASQKLTSLVGNILKLNKLENQEITPAGKPYDLCRQLCDCAILFEEKWEAKNIDFVVDIQERKVIEADESMLEIVWNNLLSNAIKFTKEGGKVTLRQTSDDDFVTVEIEDTGCGMDEETVDHIFDKFYQGDTSHSDEGNGLGLALSKRVVEIVGGNISVASELGRGTVFTVKLKTHPAQ